MAQNQKGGWAAYLVFGLAVFLAFCLVFERQIVLPWILAWMGHWHPLLLHFPIVLLLMAIFLGMWGKKVPPALLTVAVLTALITAISGFFLGKEVVAKGELLLWHQWLGGGVALLAALWYWLERIKIEIRILSKAIMLLLAVGIGFAGHYGGMVTHGEDYLALPATGKRESIPENPLIYKDVVFRILEDNCIKCHNANKQKGGLVMTSLEGLLKGGETGTALIPGNPGKSELIRRLLLAVADEEHMPPEENKPLEKDEITLLERWIALGASDTVRLNHLDIAEPLATLVRGLMEPDRLEKWTTLPELTDTTLLNLATEYLTIRRVASNTNALSINVYHPPEYDPKPVLALERVAANIVELDLSGLPLGQKELDMVAACTNLEWLELDRTPVTDSDMAKLENLSQLALLKIYETNIGDSGVAILQKMQNLKYLYMHNTRVTEAAFERLRRTNPKLSVNRGMGKDLLGYVPPGDSSQLEL